MLTRRSFLLTSSALTLSQVLAGCTNSAHIPKVVLLEDSIPLQLIATFQREMAKGQRINFQPSAQLKELYTSLTGIQEKSLLSKLPFFNNAPLTKPNLVTLGDYWLTQAIQQNLLEPLDIDKLSGWKNLAPPWQNLVKRNLIGEPDTEGKIWGAPYRGGSTMIAYRKDKFEQLGWQPQDWQDLWRKELQGRISLLHEPREVIGLTLKKLGYSYNTSDLAAIPQLKTELQALLRQARVVDSTNYLQPLVLGDIWLSVGWSTDIYPIQQRYPKIVGVIPTSGVSLWADVWVKPAKTTGGDITSQWIDYCWHSDAALAISLFTSAISPIISSADINTLTQDIQKHPLLMSKDLFDRSEFLLPLKPRVNQQYLDLWEHSKT